MFEPGDLVKIVRADTFWKHLVGKFGVFIGYEEEENRMFSHLVRPLDYDIKVRFARDDLKLVCSGLKIAEIIKEELWISE